MLKELLIPANINEQLEKVDLILNRRQPLIEENTNEELIKSKQTVFSTFSDCNYDSGIESNYTSEQGTDLDNAGSTETSEFESKTKVFPQENRISTSSDNFSVQNSRFSTIRRSPSPFRCNNSRNRSNYPVYCEPPVVTNNKLCQNQSNRNSIQSSFNLTNFGDKYGKYEATTTIDDDDDGEVSYYMMNEMACGNYVHFQEL